MDSFSLVQRLTYTLDLIVSLNEGCFVKFDFKGSFLPDIVSTDYMKFQLVFYTLVKYILTKTKRLTLIMSSDKFEPSLMGNFEFIYPRSNEGSVTFLS